MYLLNTVHQGFFRKKMKKLVHSFLCVSSMNNETFELFPVSDYIF